MEKNQNNFKKCEICGETATSLCLNCFSNLCDSCFKFIHDKKQNSQHKKEKIDYFIPYDTKCTYHPKVIVNLFCIDEKGNKIYYLYKLFLFIIELCCSFCHYKNLHQGHKLIEICDEELLKKENITLDSSIKQFDEIALKLEKLKNLIEKEINEIDLAYDNVNKKLTKSFELKHEKLIKEENDLREELQNEVTKIKEKLENFLSESNQVIKINEKINKGIKTLKKDEEKNLIKTLSYVSKINKNQKQINTLLAENMKNIKISFNEEQTKIKYEEYYFNGIPIPQDIEFREIGKNYIKLFWSINKINILNVDNNKIKFIVEIKKDSENSKFMQVYEGNNTNCLIENLEGDTTYEIRICCVYNNLIGFYTKIQKIKTSIIDSVILNGTGKQNEFEKKIKEWTGYKYFELLYRGNKDGTTSKIFHNKCDNKGPTLCLYKNEKGYVFGGYASISWTSDGSYHSAPESFIFTLTNIHGTEPLKFPNSDINYSVYHDSSRGPTFGWSEDIRILEDFKINESTTNFPCRFKDVSNKGKSIFTGDLDNNKKSFKIDEIEVFKILK